MIIKLQSTDSENLGKEEGSRGDVWTFLGGGNTINLWVEWGKQEWKSRKDHVGGEIEGKMAERDSWDCG